VFSLLRALTISLCNLGLIYIIEWSSKYEKPLTKSVNKFTLMTRYTIS